MKPKRRAATAAILIAIVSVFLAGCEETMSPYEYRKEAVVNAELTAGRTIDTVNISWTGKVDEYYDKSALAITGALVVVSESNGAWSDTLVYDPVNPGRYHSANPLHVVQPKHDYDLYIRTPAPDISVITGHTSVPDTFSIVSATLNNGDAVRWDPQAPVNSFTWTKSGNFAAYLPTISSLDPNPSLIPKAYYRDTNSTDFRRPDLVVYRVGLPKAQLNTELPWIFLNYYGRTRFDIYAVDDNLSDFVNQWMALRSGELKEIRYRLNGGIGLFASKAQAKNGFEVTLVR